MKQNTLFNYLKTTIKSSDSKPPPNTSDKKNPPATTEKKFKKVTNSPASTFKSQKGPISQEEKDIQRAIEESLKITPTPPSNTKNFKRLKKGTDIEPQNVPIKLPPKISETKKSSFLMPDEQRIEDEKEQDAVQKVVENLSKEELEFNFDKFRFGNAENQQKTATIDNMFKQRKPKTPLNKQPLIETEKKPSVNKYIIDVDKEEKENTEVLTEELASDPDEDFFNQLNKPKDQNKKPQITPTSKDFQKNPPKPINNTIEPNKDEHQRKIQEQLKRAMDQHKKTEPHSFFGTKKEDPPKRMQNHAPSTKKPENNKIVWEKKESQPPQRSMTTVGKEETKKEEKKSMTPQKDNKGSGNKKIFWGKKEKKSPNTTPINPDGPLNKLTFVMTGVLDGVDRDTLEDIIKSEGGKVTSNVSSKTSYLIIGSKLEDGREVETSSKYRKAQEHKTKILNEAELDDFLFNKTGKRLSDHIAQATSKTIGSIGGVILTSPNPKNNDQNTAKPSPAKNFQSYLGGNYQKRPNLSETKAAVNPNAMNIEPDAPAPVKSTLQATTELWTHKYAPQNLTELIGNNDCVKKIADWLQDWNKVILKGEKKDSKYIPGKQWGNAPNLNARACLISGPPGIGKTTSIRVLTKMLNFGLIEKNASDIRNKNSINTLLGDLKSNVLIGAGGSGVKRNFVILMDEVDGMSSDRGGSAALIEIIKTTMIPIICICNDRQHPKMRSLANHCYDIRFHKPQKQTIARKIGEICANEGLVVDNNGLELLCESLGHDIRQILNVLEMKKRQGKDLKFYDMKNSISSIKKDDTVMLTNFDAASKLMNRGENKKMELRDKLDLFFIDYDLIPLLIQENYLGACSRDINLETLVNTAESIAFGDVILTSIRRNNDWGLMPNFGIASCIYPTFLSSNNIPFPKFPEFLGKNSSQRKVMREIKELRHAMGPAITGDKTAVKFDYAEAILNLILSNLIDENVDVSLALEIMEHYQITPELFKENLVDIQYNPKKLDLLHKIPTVTKTSLTRQYNKLHKDTFRGKKTGKKAEGEPEIEGMKDPLYEESQNNNMEEDGENEEMEREGMGEEEEESKGKKKTEKKMEKKKGEPSKRGKKK